jgi:hypothetical protein
MQNKSMHNTEELSEMEESLEHIDNPTYEICMKAIKRDYMQIKY